MNDTGKTETFPLAEIALAFLRVGTDGEKYCFAPEGTEAIEAALDALFLSGSDTQAPIGGLLQLAFLLEDKGSLGATQTILGVLTRDTRVQAIAAKVAKKLDQNMAARLLGGPRPVQTAPQFGAQAPRGAIKAGSLLPPGTDLAQRHARARTVQRR